MKRLEIRMGSITYSIDAIGEKLIITKKHDGHEEDGTSIIIDKHSLRVLSEWVVIQDRMKEMEGTYR